MKRPVLLFLLLSVSFAVGANAQTSTFTAVLLGANEAPAPFDPKAAGFAVVTIDPAAGTAAFWLTAPNLSANPIAAHIHEGPAGVAAPVVIPLNAPFTSGFSSGTTTGVRSDVINRLLANPSGFYANIHTTQYGGGAIRGQLMPAPGTMIGSCLPDQTTLCLNGGRFKTQVSFQTSSASTDLESFQAPTIPAAVGNAVSLTGDTGFFWFFSANNIELTVKVVDGRAFNGKFWVFYGGLSDVAYTITVTDLTTGAVKTYSAMQGKQAAGNDTSAF